LKERLDYFSVTVVASAWLPDIRCF